MVIKKEERAQVQFETRVLIMLENIQKTLTEQDKRINVIDQRLESKIDYLEQKIDGIPHKQHDEQIKNIAKELKEVNEYCTENYHSIKKQLSEKDRNMIAIISVIVTLISVAMTFLSRILFK